jgi:hypothetical protein
MMPWSFKILYGLISDNFPIFGSRRRSYLLLGSLLQFMVMLLLSFYGGGNEVLVSGCLFVGNMCVAMMDVIVDSLMVI